ncbi:hypothetical protein [Nostoc sp. FACHB-133]|nr:hypothetical protein [Nostoc sp. FACHB-133]MBD2521439.1 hypothetical protein [Nostoc sp. FACHB-133]
MKPFPLLPLPFTPPSSLGELVGSLCGIREVVRSRLDSLEKRSRFRMSDR